MNRSKAERYWLYLIKRKEHVGIATLLLDLKVIKLPMFHEYIILSDAILKRWKLDKERRRRSTEVKNDSAPRSPKVIKPTKNRRF